MRIPLHTILFAFYFVYWIVHDKTPFSVWWMIGLVLITYVIQSLFISLFKKIEVGLEFAKEDLYKLEDLDRRLKVLERGQ